MGYHTSFDGVFLLDKELKPEHAKYLMAFAQTRREVRYENLTEERPDPIRIAAGLPVGKAGAYFVGEEGFMGQSSGDDIVPFDKKTEITNDQPGYWCQWIPVQADNCWEGPVALDAEGEDWTGFDAIGWDMGEKFYDYVLWLEYIMTHFLEPWGYTLNGEVQWDGEESDDIGVIEVVDNVINVHKGVASLDQLKEIEEMKSEKKAMVQTLEHLATYLIEKEADDFLEQLHTYAFKEKDEGKWGVIQGEIGEVVVYENEGPEHILSFIRERLAEEPNHIYINILEALTLVHKNQELSAWSTK